MKLDHVLIAVADLTASVAEFESRYGLASIAGGRHGGWGTANRIVPLGDAYLELIAVVDPDAAAGSAVGRWVASGQVGKPLGWAVRTGRIEAVARRLDLTLGSGSRAAAGGQRLRWRMAGIERAAAEPMLPFFIEWGPGTRFPGRVSAQHRTATAIRTLVLEGDSGRLSAWLGSHELPIVVRAGSPRVAAVVVSTAAGEIVLGSTGALE